MAATINKGALCLALLRAGSAINFKKEEEAERAYDMLMKGSEAELLGALGLADGPLQKQPKPEGSFERRPSIIEASLLQREATETAQQKEARLALKKERQRKRACSCLPWSEVYQHHGVKCGQGFEFYAWLGNKAALPENDPRLAEVRYNLADEFCTKFFERMETNRAVKMKFNTPPSEHQKLWDQSWCYTNSECGEEDLNGGGYVPGKPVHWKYARAHDDVILADMKPDALMRLAQHENQNTGYDMGVLGGFAYYLSMGEDQETLGDTMLKDAQATNLTTILQPANHLAPRMIVSGVQKWKFSQNTGHQTNAPGSWWTGFKIEDW